jgi:hypothetical protein
MQQVDMKLKDTDIPGMIAWCDAIIGERARNWQRIPTRLNRWAFLNSGSYLTFCFYYKKDAVLFKLTWG